MVDCAGARWADLTASTTFTDAGQPVDAAWRAADPAFPIVSAVCAPGGPGG
jgi:hypothetical protein